MKPQWNLKQLREYIRGSRSDSAVLLDIVHSIDRYTQIFLFHLEGARDVMNGIGDAENPRSRKNLEIVFGVSSQQDEYHLAKVASEAHILGVVHSTRAMFDVFAFLVNAMLLNGEIPEHRCDVSRVIQKIPASPLKQELEKLAVSYWFGYVSAFINTSKHRMLVRHSFHVGIEEPYVGIRIGAFEYNGQSFPVYRLRELLEGVLEVKNAIVRCGKAFNDQVVAGA
ncbi:hypothetical protein [Limnobacter sp.]|uniref:hypothetical protein n=1 Tax=Limnobacter sp. TaxID=2003368 RepID=UPI00374927F8